MHHHHAAIRTRLSTASSSSCFAERRALFASNCSSSRRVRSSTRLWAALEGATARASSRGAPWPAPWPFMAAAAGGSRVATAHRMNARHTGACQCLRRMRSAVVIARRQTSCNTWDTWAHVSQTQLRSRRRGHQTHPRKFRFEGVGVQQKRIALPGQHLRTNQHTNQHTNQRHCKGCASGGWGCTAPHAPARRVQHQSRTDVAIGSVHTSPHTREAPTTGSPCLSHRNLRRFRNPGVRG